MDKDKVDELFSKVLDFTLKYPELAPRKFGIISLDEKTWKRLLTPARLELLRVIKKHKPKSVGKLAKLVNRPVQSVSRDLRILSNYGLLELIQNGKEKRPVVEKDALMIPLKA